MSTTIASQKIFIVKGTTEARTPPPTTTTTTTTTTAAPLTPRFPVVFTPPPPTLPPVACPSVLTYTSCVQCERTCDRPDNSNCNSQFCTRGCTCPLGLVRGNNRCLRLSECPSQGKSCWSRCHDSIAAAR